MFCVRFLLLISFFSSVFSMNQEVDKFKSPEGEAWFLFLPDHLKGMALTWEVHEEKVLLVTSCLKRVDITKYVKERRAYDCRN